MVYTVPLVFLEKLCVKWAYILKITSVLFFFKKISEYVIFAIVGRGPSICLERISKVIEEIKRERQIQFLVLKIGFCCQKIINFP
jgi:histone deacetylase complex regulatory component SIN3